MNALETLWAQHSGPTLRQDDRGLATGHSGYAPTWTPTRRATRHLLPSDRFSQCNQHGLKSNTESLLHARCFSSCLCRQCEEVVSAVV